MLADYLRGLETGEQVAPAKDSLRALAERWFRANVVRWKGMTPRTYRSLLDRRVLPEFGSQRVQTLTPEAIEDWRDRILKDLPAGTVATLMRLLGSVLAMGVQRGLLSRNAAAVAVAPAVPAIERQVPSIEWCEAVLLPFLQRQGVIGLPFLLLYETGLRSGELRGLRSGDDIDLEAGVLRVRYALFRRDDGIRELRDPKTKHSIRTVPLTDRASAIIKRQKAHVARLELKARVWADNGFLFPGLMGGPMDDSTLLGVWRRLQAKLEDELCATLASTESTTMTSTTASTTTSTSAITAEARSASLGGSTTIATIPSGSSTARPLPAQTAMGPDSPRTARSGEPLRLTVHDLRHLANTAMERAGVSAERRALVLGHSRVSVTISTYTHHSLESIRDIAETMNRARRPKTSRKRAEGGGA
ncbi:MAG TPA: tyrosine-type recombinase/integrase [Chloroflexota bacterium]